MSDGDMTWFRSSNSTVPPSTSAYDLICAYLAGEITEGRLRECLNHACNWDGDQTRAAWFDAVQRGVKLAEMLPSGSDGDRGGRTTVPPESSS